MAKAKVKDIEQVAVGGAIAVEVCPCPLWDNKHKLKGYYAGIFGPNFYGDCRTYWIPALTAPGRLMSDPKVYPTPEQAMAAWQGGTIWQLAHPKDGNAQTTHKYEAMPESVRKEINERGLLRL